MAAQFRIYSDGGGELASSAASACIVEKVSSGERRYFLAYLGPGTNNEAELFAGLLGFIFFKGKNIEKRISLIWQSDSQYVLKSAKEYILKWQCNGWKTANKDDVKNQGFWKTYLKLTKNVDVAIEHVPGHSGHPENEACDEAATWARKNADSELANANEGRVFEVASAKWMLFDGREVIAALRELFVDEAVVECFCEKLSAFANKVPAQKANSS